MGQWHNSYFSKVRFIKLKNITLFAVGSYASFTSLLYVKYFPKYDNIHDFSVWLKTNSYLDDNNRFQRYTDNKFTNKKVLGVP